MQAGRKPLCTIISTLLLLMPMFASAQDEAAEEPPPPPPDVAETAGVWWARMGDSEFQAAVFAALVNIAAIIIISAIVYFVAMALLSRAIRRVDRETTRAVQPHRRRSQRIGTVLELVRSIVQWVILITSGVWILASAGMDIRPVLAGAGILGLAVGFGSQNLVRDIVSGFFVLLEAQYAVGDYVQLGPNFGMVESVGMRVTVLKDLDNQRHYMPNGTIMQVTVYEEPFVNHLIEVPLADGEHCDDAMRVVADAMSRLQEDYRRYLVYYEPPTSRMCGSSGALIRVPVAIFPTQEWLVNEEIPASLNEALTAAEIPLREGRSVRVYLDLSRMPEYRHAADSPDGEVI